MSEDEDENGIGVGDVLHAIGIHLKHNKRNYSLLVAMICILGGPWFGSYVFFNTQYKLTGVVNALILMAAGTIILTKNGWFGEDDGRRG